MLNEREAVRSFEVVSRVVHELSPSPETSMTAESPFSRFLPS
jgi:hypothetical protein